MSYIATKLVCDDHLIVSVSDVLRQYGYRDTEVSEGNQLGRVTIHGTIQAGPQWEKVQEVLTLMPGLKGWRVINYQGEMINLLINKLRAFELLGYLSLAENKKYCYQWATLWRTAAKTKCNIHQHSAGAA